MYRLIATLCAVLWGFACTHANDDNETLDNIYRAFMVSPVNLEAVKQRYADNIIHVSAPGRPLLQGQADFMATNVTPMANMINTGALDLSMKVYIVRRVIGALLANDVGYIYSAVKMPDGSQQEMVQKFSWVMTRTPEGWQVITDFDGVPASPDVLSGPFERVIE